MAPRALLFDFDGVIADTENHHVAAWQRTLLALGWHIADEVAMRAAEVDDRQFLRELFADQAIEGGDIDGWVRKKQELTVALLKDAPRVYPGVTGLVESLRGRARLAIVSGTWRANVQSVLTESGLDSAFDFVIGKEDVKATKPDPEAYRKALSKLRLPATAVVALEDSPSGLASARSAGIACLAIGHRRPFGQWVGDSAYFSGLEPVSGLLEHLGFG